MGWPGIVPVVSDSHLSQLYTRGHLKFAQTAAALVMDDPFLHPLAARLPLARYVLCDEKVQSGSHAYNVFLKYTSLCAAAN
jgi:hypothetical protein